MNKKRVVPNRETPESESTLAFSEEWLRALVEQTLAGIYLIQNGFFRYANQGFADIFGYSSPADLIDKVNIAQLIALRAGRSAKSRRKRSPPHGGKRPGYALHLHRVTHG